MGGEGPAEVGPLIRRGAQVDVGVLAQIGPARLAGPALAAGDVIGRHDPVASLDRVAHAVPLHALAQAVDFAHKLVALAGGPLPHAHRGGAFPVLHVRAADIGAQHLDQQRALLRLRQVVLHDAELPASLKKRDSSFHAVHSFKNIFLQPSPGPFRLSENRLQGAA